jgi:hypothetical protein
VAFDRLLGNRITVHRTVPIHGDRYFSVICSRETVAGAMKSGARTGNA